MTNSVQKGKIDFQRVAPIIAISFAVGFGVATGAYFFIFCDDCFALPLTDAVGLSPEKKCEDDSRCIPEPPIIPDPDISEKGFHKISLIQQIVDDPIIQQALKESNEEFDKMSPSLRENILAQREKQWTTAQVASPFMRSIIYNDISDFLRNNLVIPTEQYGDMAFGEHILTNIYGPNVAVSIKTDNYDQSNDDWWQESKKNPRPFARQCEFDESAQMYSEDIVVQILDEKGQFIGIMNSATPCDVTQKASETATKIEPVPFDNITPIGQHKISQLEQLMKNPVIQDVLKKSNEEFSDNCDAEKLQLKGDREWPKPTEGEPTALQLSILNNEVAEILRENLEIQSEEFGELNFPEYILTNACGVNVSITMRTYNYFQAPYEWWQVAKDNGILVRECGWDRSIKMTSEDIIISIYDDKGEFSGILNSATECNVIQNKSPTFYGDSN